MNPETTLEIPPEPESRPPSPFAPEPTLEAHAAPFLPDPDLAVETRALTRVFGQNRLLALDRLDLAVPRGVVFGYLGPNGSGKTTTIRLLLGLLEPSAGNAAVLGRDVRKHAPEIRRAVGALLEHPGLYDRLTAEDNLDFHARVWGYPRQERRRRVADVLDRLALLDRRRDVVGTWSRGMRQKLGVARALLHDPPLVFLDEPTSGLDPVAAAELRAELAALVHDRGLTVFLTTHNLNEAQSLCKSVAIIHRGTLLAAGPPADLRARHAGLRAEFRGANFHPELVQSLREHPEVQSAQAANDALVLNLRPGAPLAPIVRIVVRSGADVEEVRRDLPTLEEVFLQLVKSRNQSENLPDTLLEEPERPPAAPRTTDATLADHAP